MAKMIDVGWQSYRKHVLFCDGYPNLQALPPEWRKLALFLLQATFFAGAEWLMDILKDERCDDQTLERIQEEIERFHEKIKTEAEQWPQRSNARMN